MELQKWTSGLSTRVVLYSREAAMMPRMRSKKRRGVPLAQLGALWSRRVGGRGGDGVFEWCGKNLNVHTLLILKTGWGKKSRIEKMGEILKSWNASSPRSHGWPFLGHPKPQNAHLTLHTSHHVALHLQRGPRTTEF